MDTNIAAFFDIDGTFYRDSLLVEHFKKLVKHEIIDPIVWHSNVKSQFQNWDQRQGSYDMYLLDVVTEYQKHLIGVNYEDIDFIAREIIKSKSDRVYKFTKEKIREHLKLGHKVIFISGSPDFLVSKMANKYKATDYRGSIYHMDENKCFNGKITPMWDSESKKKAIKELSEIYEVDLSKSFAYGDTSGDFTMLNSAGNPVTINPTKELLTKIMESDDVKEKIKIIVERKDVTYKLSPENIEF